METTNPVPKQQSYIGLHRDRLHRLLKQMEAQRHLVCRLVDEYVPTSPSTMSEPVPMEVKKEGPANTLDQCIDLLETEARRVDAELERFFPDRETANPSSGARVR